MARTELPPETKLEKDTSKNAQAKRVYHVGNCHIPLGRMKLVFSQVAQFVGRNIALKIIAKTKLNNQRRPKRRPMHSDFIYDDFITENEGRAFPHPSKHVSDAITTFITNVIAVKRGEADSTVSSIQLVDGRFDNPLDAEFYLCSRDAAYNPDQSATPLVSPSLDVGRVSYVNTFATSLQALTSDTKTTKAILDHIDRTSNEHSVVELLCDPRLVEKLPCLPAIKAKRLHLRVTSFDDIRPTQDIRTLQWSQPAISQDVDICYVLGRRTLAVGHFNALCETYNGHGLVCHGSTLVPYFKRYKGTLPATDDHSADALAFWCHQFDHINALNYVAAGKCTAHLMSNGPYCLSDLDVVDFEKPLQMPVVIMNALAMKACYQNMPAHIPMKTLERVVREGYTSIGEYEHIAALPNKIPPEIFINDEYAESSAEVQHVFDVLGIKPVQNAIIRQMQVV